ncbi:MAG: hypothetical protein WCA21_02175 [Terracidiphilus sp.]
MISIDVSRKIIRWPLIALGMLLLLPIANAVFGPTLAASGDYLFRPHQITCQGFTVSVPFGWEVSATPCSYVLLEKRSRVLVHYMKNSSELWISSFPALNPVQFDETEEHEFRQSIPNETFIPFQLNNRLKNCLRVNNYPGIGGSAIGCWDGEHGVKVEFIGNTSDISEVGKMIQ